MRVRPKEAAGRDQVAAKTRIAASRRRGRGLPSSRHAWIASHRTIFKDHTLRRGPLSKEHIHERTEAGRPANLAARLPVFHHAGRDRGPHLAVRALPRAGALGGAVPGGRGRRDRVRPGRHQRAPVLLQPRLVQRHPGEGRGSVLDAAADGVLLLGGDLRRQRHLPIRAAIVSAHPLAALDDAALHRALAGGREPLPDAAVRQRRRQPGPAHPGGRRPVHQSHPGHRRSALVVGVDAGLLLRHPVANLGRLHHSGHRDPACRASWSGARSSTPALATWLTH